MKGVAAAFISNCYTKSRRDKVISQLREHVKIDVYGQCSDQHLVCDRSNDDSCMQMLNSSYKVRMICSAVKMLIMVLFQFYLAFENSLCADYITEKFFKVLEYNVIPVVLNGVNMTKFAPKHSYIDIKDFDSVKGDTSLIMIALKANEKMHLPVKGEKRMINKFFQMLENIFSK